MNFVFVNKVFTRGKESRRNYIRLFDKTKGGFNYKKVHEGIEIKGTTKHLKGRIWHYSYKSITHYFDKFNRYTSLGAELICEKKKKKPVALVVVSFPFYFFKYYLLEENFRNGMPGFYWASFQSFYHFVKYIKVREQYHLSSMAAEADKFYFQSRNYVPAMDFSLQDDAV